MNDTEIILRLRDMADLYEQKEITVNQLEDFMLATLKRINARHEPSLGYTLYDLPSGKPVNPQEL